MALFRLSLALTCAACAAWTAPHRRPPSAGSARPAPSPERRDLLARGVLVAAAAAGLPAPAFAAAAQEQRDKENIVKGYARLQYFLDHWEEETTVCKKEQETTFGDKCERTPVKVMEYLGFKSTTDPLFKAEVTMRRLTGLVPGDRDGDFFDAVDAFSQNAEEANSMAFVSSWGESNPGGGKDRVALFIERSKKNVIVSRDSLKTVMDILELKP